MKIIECCACLVLIRDLRPTCIVARSSPLGHHCLSWSYRACPNTCQFNRVSPWPIIYYNTAITHSYKQLTSLNDNLFLCRFVQESRFRFKIKLMLIHFIEFLLYLMSTWFNGTKHTCFNWHIVWILSTSILWTLIKFNWSLTRN